MGRKLDEKIRHRAYALWEAESCPEGREMEFWLKAEQEIKSELVRTAAPKAARKKAATKKAEPRTAKAKPKKPAATKAAAKPTAS